MKKAKRAMALLSSLLLVFNLFMGYFSNGVAYAAGESNYYGVLVGETKDLVAVIQDIRGKEVTEDTTIKWTTSDKNIATISSKGQLKGIKEGFVDIKATIVEGAIPSEAIVKVQVKSTVSGIKLSNSDLKMKMGEEIVLGAELLPKEPFKEVFLTTVTWKSLDPKVVTIDTKGKVKAVGNGVTTVTATTTDGGYIAECTISVDPYINKIEFDEEEIEIKVGEKLILSPKIFPEDAIDKTVIWTSEDNSVVSVNTKGEIKGEFEGTTKVTGTTKDGGLSATITVHVIPMVTGVTLNKNEITLLKGTYEDLEATIVPEDALEKTVIWSTDNTAVATVNTAGRVRAVARGTAIVTATTKDGRFTASCIVNVVDTAVTGIQFDPKEVDLFVGEIKTLQYKIIPEDATDLSVTFKSSNTSIATVNNKGEIKGIAKGTVQITATTKDGGFEDICTVNVIPMVTGVKIIPEETEIYVGEVKTLEKVIIPSEALNQEVTWESSNAKIVKVDSKGAIMGIANGEALITATTKDGEFKAHTKVIVKNMVESFDIVESKIVIGVGGKHQFNSIILPENAYNQTVLYTMLNSSIATVSATGEVTGKAVGKTVIAFMTADGGLHDTCEIEVVAVVDKILIYDKNGNLISDSKNPVDPPVIEEGNWATWTEKNNVEKDKTWTIKFNYSIRESILKDLQTIYVKDSKGIKVPVEIVLKEDNKVVEIKPLIPYGDGKTYFLYVTNNTESKDGKKFKKHLEEKGTLMKFTIKNL